MTLPTVGLTSAESAKWFALSLVLALMLAAPLFGVAALRTKWRNEWPLISRPRHGYRLQIAVLKIVALGLVAGIAATVGFVLTHPEEPDFSSKVLSASITNQYGYVFLNSVDSVDHNAKTARVSVTRYEFGSNPSFTAATPTKLTCLVAPRSSNPKSYALMCGNEEVRASRKPAPSPRPTPVPAPSPRPTTTVTNKPATTTIKPVTTETTQP